MRSRLSMAAILVTLAGGCSDLGPDETLQEELERAQRSWAAEGPEAYVYGVERICFCGLESRGPVRVRVEAGVVTERAYVESGEPVPSALADLFPSVEGLFDLVRDAISMGAHTVRVTYDPELGVPVDLWIDYHAQVADEELGMRVAEPVEPLP